MRKKEPSYLRATSSFHASKPSRETIRLGLGSPRSAPLHDRRVETPENTVVLSDSGSTGTFEITISQEDMSIIVFDADGLYDCNEYEFFVFDEND